MTDTTWHRRVPPLAWLLLAALLLNMATTILWPAFATLGCDPHSIPTTSIHPNGTVEEGPPLPVDCPSSFWQTLGDSARSWPFEALLFPFFGGHLFWPGHYDARPVLGWAVWSLAVASPAASIYLGRDAPPRSWFWRIPLAYLIAALVSGSWIQEWEQFD